MKRPGVRLRAFAARVCSEKTMERLIDPVVADLQTEYASAIGVRRRWLTRMAGYIAFAKVSLWCALLGVREAGRNWSDEDRQGLRHTLWLSACAIVIVSVPLWLLELPSTRALLESMQDTEFPPTASVQRLMFYLVPAILPLSMPIGLAIGVAFGAHRRALSRRLIATIILLALATSAISVMNVGWLSPATNQLFREAIVGEFVMKGDRELTLPQLNRLAQPSVRARPGIRSDRYRSFVFEFHHRLAFAIAPLTFCAFALVLALRRRAKPLTALVAVSFTGVAYLMIRWLGNALSVNESVAPQLGAWMPQLALLVTTIVVGIPRTFIRTRA
jgi:lipopolysaccharide export system permease LptF/LptG-like protein